MIMKTSAILYFYEKGNSSFANMCSLRHLCYMVEGDIEGATKWEDRYFLVSLDRDTTKDKVFVQVMDFHGVCHFMYVEDEQYREMGKDLLTLETINIEWFDNMSYKYNHTWFMA